MSIDVVRPTGPDGPARPGETRRRRRVAVGADGYGGHARTAPIDRPAQRREEKPMILLRRELGDELRHQRLRQGRTLREVSAGARVSLGYLSEVERGQKEASSELLASICSALDIPLSVLLRDVADRVATVEPAPPTLDVARPMGPVVAPVAAATTAVATSVAA